MVSSSNGLKKDTCLSARSTWIIEYGVSAFGAGMAVSLGEKGLGLRDGGRIILLDRLADSLV